MESSSKYFFVRRPSMELFDSLYLGFILDLKKFIMRVVLVFFVNLSYCSIFKCNGIL